MYGYIYLTINLINGKKYIGQHKGEFDKNYLGSGKLIRRAIKKYGKDNFVVSILEYASNSQRLNELEIDYISKLKRSGEDNYNLAKMSVQFKFIPTFCVYLYFFKIYFSSTLIIFKFTN